MKVNSDIEADEGGLSSIVGRIRQVLLMRWLTLVIVSVAVFALVGDLRGSVEVKEIPRMSLKVAGVSSWR